MNEFVALNNEFEQSKCQIVASFFMNNKNYLFYKDNLNNFYTGFVDGEDIKQIINNQEFQQVEEVFKALKNEQPKKPDFIDFGEQYYRGNRYKTIYDNIEDNCFTYEFRNNRYTEVSGDIKEHFDNIYNQDIENLFMGNEKNEGNKFKKRIIKVGKLLIVVILVANFSFTAIKTVDLNKGFMQNVSAIMEIYKVDEQEAKNILSYIEKNDRLPNPEKEFILDQEHFFNENEQYFDMAAIKRNLSNLKIVYDKDNQANYKMSERVKGFYQNFSDKIVIFYSDKLDDDIVTQKVLFHEVMHAISNKGYVAKGSLGLALTEGVNELMAEEYLNTYSDTYNKGQTYARIMCEIIGPEKIKESFFKGNVEMLVKDLSSITGNEKDAKRFISLLDTEASADTAILLNENQESVSDAKKTLAIVQPQIDIYLKLYYEAKFNNTIEEDKLMLAYMDSIRLTNNLNNEFYQENNMEKINVVKHYFNSKLIEKDQNVTVEYMYKNETTKQIKTFNVIKTEDGKYRRTFSNGQFIDYDKDPSLVTYKKANYSFQDEDRLIDGVKARV